MSPSKFPRTVLKVYCVVVAAVTAVLCWAITGNPERHAATALLQYLPYPLYLAPAVVAAVLSVWLGWRWRAVAGVSLALVLVVLMDLSVGMPDEGHGHVRFMSYNAKTMYAVSRQNGLGELAQEILAHDPDVLVMQDAGDMGYLKRSNPEVFAVIVGDRKVHIMGQYLLASRLPFKDCKVGWISFRNKAHTYLHCVLTAHGKEVDVVTVHLLTPRVGLNAVRYGGVDGLGSWQQNMLDRLTQARALASDVGRMTRSRIVAGDLNAPERSAVVQMLLETGLRDVYSSASVGYGFTHGHSLKPGIPFLRIDHILVSDDIGVAKAYVGGHKASEHSPVIADLRMHRE